MPSATPDDRGRIARRIAAREELARIYDAVGDEANGAVNRRNLTADRLDLTLIHTAERRKG